MSKPIIGVDVDLTVCPSDIGWLDWLVQRSKREDTLPYSVYGNKRHYDLSKYFPSEQDPFEYWRSLEYSQFQPLKGSVEKLEQLSTYFDIVFISAIKGKHNKEKYYWLREHFPFLKGYMATKEKFLMNNSVCAMIDDRLDNLQGFDQHKRVFYKTPYSQNETCGVGYVIEDWESFSVKDFCEQYLN